MHNNICRRPIEAQNSDFNRNKRGRIDSMQIINNNLDKISNIHTLKKIRSTNSISISKYNLLNFNRC